MVIKWRVSNTSICQSAFAKGARWRERSANVGLLSLVHGEALHVRHESSNSTAMVLELAVGIATAGRRDQLALTLKQIAKSQTLPSAVLICPASPEDFDGKVPERLTGRVRVVSAPKGLCSQRNAIVRACEGMDLLTFFDDDYYPSEGYLERVHQVFGRHTDVVVLTGRPLLDGATGPGLSHAEAVEALEELPVPRKREGRLKKTYGGYGCNMSFRLETIRRHALLFDENLPLYGWLEDIDFSRQMSRFGRVVIDKELRGVHLGTKRGRSPGRQLGYSQIVNPVYMIQKGTIGYGFAMKFVLRNLAKNALRSFSPEPWVDRRGRFVGNAIALAEICLGKAHPERATMYR